MGEREIDADIRETARKLADSGNVFDLERALQDERNRWRRMSIEQWRLSETERAEKAEGERDEARRVARTLAQAGTAESVRIVTAYQDESFTETIGRLETELAEAQRGARVMAQWISMDARPAGLRDAVKAALAYPEQPSATPEGTS